MEKYKNAWENISMRRKILICVGKYYNAWENIIMRGKMLIPVRDAAQRELAVNGSWAFQKPAIIRINIK